MPKRAVAGSIISTGRPSSPRGGIALVILQRHARHLAAARRETHCHHVVLHRELLRFGLTGRSERRAQRLHLTFAHGGGRHRIRRGNRLSGGGRRHGRGRGQRILIGLPPGHLLLVFLLFLRIHIGEAQKEHRHYGNSDN